MIRLGTKRDVPALVALGRYLIAESVLTGLYDEIKAESFLHWLLTSPNMGIVIVSELEGEIVGAMLGLVSAPPYTHQLQAAEYGIFVAPQHRGKFQGPRLLKAFEARAKELGAEYFYPGVMTGELGAQVLYRKRGYKDIGSVWMKRL
jgi:GNAT superfamily N-acetyltransferase